MGCGSGLLFASLLFLRSCPVVSQGGLAGRFDAQFRALVPPSSTGKRCFAAFLFHVEKCAGTTLRKHFEHLEGVESFRQGTVIFLRRNQSSPVVPHAHCSSNHSWFREAASCSWEQLVVDLASHPPRKKEPTGRNRVFVEIASVTSNSPQYPDSLARIIRGVQRVRAAWEPRGCEVVLFTLVREPLSHLLAAYNYFVVNAQHRTPRLHGRNFSEWIASPVVHNLQSRLLSGESIIRIQIDPVATRQRRDTFYAKLRADRSVDELLLEDHPMLAKMYRTTPSDVHLRLPHLLQSLSQFDLVAPVDRFDELWFTLASRIGVTALRYHTENKGNITRMQRDAHRRRAGGAAANPKMLKKPAPLWHGDELSARPELVHSLDAPTQEWLLRDKLSGDLALYQNVSASWASHVAQLDEATRSRMRKFSKLMLEVKAIELAQQARFMTRMAALEAQLKVAPSAGREGPPSLGGDRVARRKSTSHSRRV